VHSGCLESPVHRMCSPCVILCPVASACEFFNGLYIFLSCFLTRFCIAKVNDPHICIMIVFFWDMEFLSQFLDFFIASLLAEGLLQS
jgi:hypothetical protein